MTPSPRSRTARALRVAAPLAIAAAAAFVLFHFPPTQYSFYPQCPIDRYFHLRCPGCGTTRALAALLQGNIREALRLNPLTTLLLLPAAIYAIFCYRRFIQCRPFLRFHPPSSAIYAALAVAVLFTIARNVGHF